MAQRKRRQEDLIELKEIHQKVIAGIADLTARRITPEQLNEISHRAERRIKAIEKRMRRNGIRGISAPATA